MKTIRQFFAALVAVSVAFPLGAQMRKVEPLFPCSPVLRDAYGICSHITRRSMDFDLRHDDIAHALRARAATIRSDFDFSTVFPKGKDKADNTVFDAVLASCDSAGMKLLPIIVGATDKGWGWQRLPAAPQSPWVALRVTPPGCPDTDFNDIWQKVVQWQ